MHIKNMRVWVQAVAGWILACSAGAATSPWMDPALSSKVRADLLLAQMTLAEKIAMLHGWPGPCVGNGTNNDRLGIPALHLQDGPAGVGDGVQGVTALPAPILLAATWDTTRARQYGSVIGAEARGKGIHVSLGPMINLVRVPQGGRSFETFGEDPYLSGALAAEHIRGIQSQQVIAGAKHFICNDQESWRGNEMTTVDERALHEIYFPPFVAAVRGGVGSITAAYNGVNGRWSSESPLLGAKLKTMFGFDGFIDCDWGANFAMKEAVDNGLDLEMPYDTRFGSPLQTAVESGNVPTSQLDDMVRRVLVPMFRFGIFDHPPSGTVSTVVTTPAHAQFAKDTAVEGMVLLKNNSSLLPLNSSRLHSVVVCGSVASVAPIWVGGGSAIVYLPYYDDPLTAISNRAGAGVTITYLQGDTGGSISDAVKAAQSADVAIVCVGEQTGEGTDRTSLSLPNDQDQLVSAVAAANPKTIVVLYEGAGTLMPWSTNVAAIVVAWYPGQENGRSLAAILFGDANPSGKLPVTFPASASQVPANTPAQFPGTNLQVVYSEGLLIGYRWYNESNIAPLFPFGHGMSYTTFVYSNLIVSTVGASGRATVSCIVANTGNRAGSEIAQLYLRFPVSAHEPPRQLKGFKKLLLEPGAASTVAFDLTWEDLAYWRSDIHAWAVPAGRFRVLIGASSEDIRLTADLFVPASVPVNGIANRALFQSASASSILDTNHSSAAVTDGDPATGWTSLIGDPQWITVDLGQSTSISRVRLRWGSNFARNYQIQLSENGNNWVSVFLTNFDQGGLEDILLNASGRFVRMYANQNGTGSRYTLQEFEVYAPEIPVFPRLRVRSVWPNSAVLSWTAAWAGSELYSNNWLNWKNYVVEQSSNLIASNWFPLPVTSTVTNGEAQVLLSPLPSKRYFRLRSP